eukprot:3907811-Amphidinium_carterae.1
MSSWIFAASLQACGIKQNLLAPYRAESAQVSSGSTTSFSEFFDCLGSQGAESFAAGLGLHVHRNALGLCLLSLRSEPVNTNQTEAHTQGFDLRAMWSRSQTSCSTRQQSAFRTEAHEPLPDPAEGSLSMEEDSAHSAMRAHNPDRALIADLSDLCATHWSKCWKDGLLQAVDSTE